MAPSRGMDDATLAAGPPGDPMSRTPLPEGPNAMVPPERPNGVGSDKSNPLASAASSALTSYFRPRLDGGSPISFLRTSIALTASSSSR